MGRLGVLSIPDSVDFIPNMVIMIVNKRPIFSCPEKWCSVEIGHDIKGIPKMRIRLSVKLFIEYKLVCFMGFMV